MNPLYIEANSTKANILNTEFYTRPEDFEVVKEKLFAAYWQFIGSKELEKFAGNVQLLPSWKNGQAPFLSVGCG